MTNRHNQLYLPAQRRHAVPIVTPSAGGPLIKSTPSLGRMLEWRKGRSVVPSDMPDEERKRKVWQDFHIFKQWMEKEDGAHFRGQVKVHGPFPHFDAHEPDTQYGDNGASRKVARSIIEDTKESGFEDYVIEALFDVPEGITEVPTDLALDLAGKGRVKLLRTDMDGRGQRNRDWREVIRGSSNN